MTISAGESFDTATELAPVAGEGKVIEGRSLGQLAWARLRKDKVAMAGGVVSLILILIAISAWPLTWLGWIHPNDSNADALNIENSMPAGSFGGVTWEHPFGVDPQLGRDIMDRVIVGLQTSLSIALAATVLAIVVGVTVGVLAGFFGGWVDAVLARIMDILLAFPVLLFSIALLVILRTIGEIGPLAGNTLSYVALVAIIGGFGWAYPARIIRGQALSLREKEFVEAARSLGARNGRIVFKELLPNLVAPILVYATLLLPVNILVEAGLSYLGVGLNPPTASLGQMIDQASRVMRIDPTYLLIPGVTIFITVLAFNLFGDGLRDAIDPKSSR
jgi:peptide/nickel transport system permease protein